VKKLRPLLVLLGVLVVLAATVILYFPVQELLGRRNTRYSERFSGNSFSQIQIGMPRERVVELLGPPLSTRTHPDYPVWALREEQVRSRYGKDNLIQMEVLSFSEPKDSGRDYELVRVALGPDSTVIATEKWVTD
jgi:hypothetical protein